MFPDDQPLSQCILRFGRWLLASRWTRDGFTGWSYQHDYDGKLRHFTFYSKEPWVDLPSPTQWHHETLARLMGYCTRTTGDPAFLEAWIESHEHREDERTDHAVAAAVQFLPWLAMELWRPRWTSQGVQIDPLRFGARTPAQAVIHTPDGTVQAKWTDDGRAELSAPAPAGAAATA
jgi:hypothetical protein